MGALRYFLSHFFVRGIEVKRWRDKETGRFIRKPVTAYREPKTGKFAKKPEYYRAVVSANHIPFQHEYVNFTYQKIDKLENIDLDTMKRRLIEHMEDYFGYSKKDWWFNVYWSVQNPRLEPDAAEPDEYFEELIA